MAFKRNCKEFPCISCYNKHIWTFNFIVKYVFSRDLAGLASKMDLKMYTIFLYKLVSMAKVKYCHATHLFKSQFMSHILQIALLHICNTIRIMNNIFSGANKALKPLNLHDIGLWNIAENSSYPSCIVTILYSIITMHLVEVKLLRIKVSKVLECKNVKKMNMSICLCKVLHWSYRQALYK